MPSRVRHSIEYLQTLYDTNEDKSMLDKVIKAFIGIQALPAEHENSFWKIAAYHGEPDNNYCHHETVLFPTWHRAYLLRLENALRSIEGCEDVTMPFWDETITALSHIQDHSIQTVPLVFTSPTYKFEDNTEVANPLYSYKLQRGIAQEKEERWSKPAGYNTVRYPKSGLVGNKAMAGTSTAHNMQFIKDDSNAETLRNNVRAWLEGRVEIPTDGVEEGDRISADTYSVLARYKIAMNAPNYTVYSNTQSQAQWIEDMGHEDGTYYVASIESPHNGIHLALGGFFQEAVYNANPIRGANGDMGANEVASYDPIFYFHHCFIDLQFWNWQRRAHHTSPGSLEVIDGYAGAFLGGGKTEVENLDMETPLKPFKTSTGEFYTSYDVTNIEELDYVYGPCSMDQFVWGFGGINRVDPPAKMVAVKNISTADYPGSFVIRLYSTDANGKKVEVGREPILSRYNVMNCPNCVQQQDIKAMFPIAAKQLNAIKGTRSANDMRYSVDIEGTDGVFPTPRSGRAPTIEVL